MANTIVFQPVRTRRLSEVVEDHIRELILTGQVKSGDRLPTEKELAVQFGVSIVTVREALRGLEAFGIVEKKRGKDGGVFVSDMKCDSVKSVLHGFLSSRRFNAANLAQVRSIIEPAAARFAALAATRDALQDIEDNINGCERKLAALGPKPSRDDYDDLEERTVEFHRLVAEATGNPVLIFIEDYVMDFLISLTKRLPFYGDLEVTRRIIKQHRRILNCLRRGDAAGAEEAMADDVKDTSGYLMDKENVPGGVITVLSGARPVGGM